MLFKVSSANYETVAKLLKSKSNGFAFFNNSKKVIQNIDSVNKGDTFFFTRNFNLENSKQSAIKNIVATDKSEIIKSVQIEFEINNSKIDDNNALIFYNKLVDCNFDETFNVLNKEFSKNVTEENSRKIFPFNFSNIVGYLDVISCKKIAISTILRVKSKEKKFDYIFFINNKIDYIELKKGDSNFLVELTNLFKGEFLVTKKDEKVTDLFNPFKELIIGVDKWI